MPPGELNELRLIKVGMPQSPLPLERRQFIDNPEMSGFGLFGDPSIPKFRVHLRLAHAEGEANRIRAMPSRNNWIGSISSTGALNIYDIAPAMEQTGGLIPRQITLKGHNCEGWGLAWNPLEEGIIASGADDSKLMIWDLGKGPADLLLPGPSSESPVCVLDDGHRAPIQDISFRPGHAAQIVSSGDDGRMCLWDRRQPAAAVITKSVGEALNAISCHQGLSWLVATGGVDRYVYLYDLRRADECVTRFQGHSDTVTCIEMCPYDDRYLVSGSVDRNLLVWDLSGCGREQTLEDAADGPPELMFMHHGHSGPINDVSWNNRSSLYPMTLASVCEEGGLQIWSLSEKIWCDIEGPGEIYTCASQIAVE